MSVRRLAEKQPAHFAFTPENNSQKAEANSFDTTKRQSDLSPSWVVCQPSRPQRRGVLGQPKGNHETGVKV